MFDLRSIISTKTLSGPAKVVVYGAPGVGKTLLATAFPVPFLIRTEDGGNSLRFRDVATKKEGPCKSLFEVEEQIDALIQFETPFKTLVIDSMDWLGTLIEQAVCSQLGIKTVSDLDYGRGFSKCYVVWKDFLAKLDVLREKRGMMIVFTAHAASVEQRDPEGEKYTSYGLKLTKGAAALVTEWADEVWFLTTDVRASSASRTDKTKIGKGTGGRVVHVSLAPGFTAKTRQLLCSEYNVGQDRNFSAILSAFFNGEEND